MIGRKAFSDCTSLFYIYIPKNVEYIFNEAFYYCNNLTIHCEATSKPINWAEGWNISNCFVIWGVVK